MWKSPFILHAKVNVYCAKLLVIWLKVYFSVFFSVHVYRGFAYITGCMLILKDVDKKKINLKNIKIQLQDVQVYIRIIYIWYINSCIRHKWVNLCENGNSLEQWFNVHILLFFSPMECLWENIVHNSADLYRFSWTQLACASYIHTLGCQGYVGGRLAFH